MAPRRSQPGGAAPSVSRRSPRTQICMPSSTFDPSGRASSREASYTFSCRGDLWAAAHTVQAQYVNNSRDVGSTHAAHLVGGSRRPRVG
eukprot:7330156-Prymnesium_polylepis.3